MSWLLVGPLLLIASLSLGHGANAETRGDAMASVKSLIDKNQTRLIELDAFIAKALMDIRNLGLAQNPNTRSKLVSLEKELESLSFQRREHLLRQEFLDRLSFQVDRHFRGGDLKAFLEKKTLEMAQTEIGSPDANTNLWKFLSYLSLAIKELPERHEDPFAFVEGYMRFSTLLSPVRPDEYLAMRNYTNGHEFETAQPMDADRVGEVVEAQILEAQAMNQKDSLPFEQRKPFLKPLSQTFEPSSTAPVNTHPLAPPMESLERPQLLKEEVVQSLKDTEPLEAATPQVSAEVIINEKVEVKAGANAPAQAEPKATVSIPNLEVSAGSETPVKTEVAAPSAVEAPKAGIAPASKKKAIPLPPPYSNSPSMNEESSPEMKVELIPADQREKQTR